MRDSRPRSRTSHNAFRGRATSATYSPTSRSTCSTKDAYKALGSTLDVLEKIKHLVGLDATSLGDFAHIEHQLLHEDAIRSVALDEPSCVSGALLVGRHDERPRRHR